MRLVLAPAACPREKGVSWACFGTTPALRASIEERLGAEGRRPLGRELTAVARSLRAPYLDWVAAVGRAQGDRRSWWASTLSGRSPLQSDLFQLACSAELLRRWAAEGRGPEVAVVEDPWLAETVAAALPGLPREGSPRAGRLLDAAVRSALAPFALLANLLHGACAAALARGLGLTGVRPRPGAALLFTWIDARSFGPDGRLRDPYTGRLEGLLGATTRVTPWHLSPGELLALAGKGALCPAGFLTVADLLGAARFFAPSGPLPALAGLDMSWLVRREVLRERSRAAFSRHLLAHSAFRALARACPDAGVFVYPFENHPWEKMLCLAWREEGRRGRLIGVQHSTVPELLLNHFAGAGEAAEMPLPDAIAASGERPARLLREGLGGARVVNAGSLRYETAGAA